MSHSETEIMAKRIARKRYQRPADDRVGSGCECIANRMRDTGGILLSIGGEYESHDRCIQASEEQEASCIRDRVTNAWLRPRGSNCQRNIFEGKSQ